MNFTDIFEAYYNLYRLEATTPASTDDEYTIALRLANEALTRWANYDNTYWRELFSTAVDAGVDNVSDGVFQYDAPDDFKEGGGSVRLLNSDGGTFTTYPILNAEDGQFKSDSAQYAYFSGNPNDGYVLNLNPVPDSTVDGKEVQYDYYKKPTLYTSGSSVSEIPNAYFVVHRMLANRFRGSRNPYYLDALRDAEDALRIMQLENNSGTWANPWIVPDRSGIQWGS